MWRLEGGQGQVSVSDVLVNQSGQGGEKIETEYFLNNNNKFK